MIAKITGGGNFRGVLDYLMQLKKESQNQKQEAHENKSKDIQANTNAERHRLIGGNMTGSNPQELTEEFEVFREQRPDIKKPVHHISLSAAKGESLSDKKWNEIARKYVENAGFTRSPYVVIQHIDTEHDHIHIVASRIDINGKVISDFKSKTRAEEFLREVEREYSLKPVQSSREHERTSPKRGEIEVFNRTGKLSVKMSLQGHIDYALKDNPTFAEFISKLERVGVEVIPFRRVDEKVTGVSFKLNGQLMKGSNLGSGYSWNGLQNRGMSYEYERDLLAVQSIKNQERSLAEKSVESKIHDDDHAVISLINQTYSNKSIHLHNNSLQNFARDNEADKLHQAAGLEFDKDTASKVERLNKIVGVELKESTQEKSKAHESLAALKEHQSPTLTPELNKHEMQKETKEKTADRNFDRIR